MLVDASALGGDDALANHDAAQAALEVLALPVVVLRRPVQSSIVQSALEVLALPVVLRRPVQPTPVQAALEVLALPVVGKVASRTSRSFSHSTHTHRTSR